MAGCLQSNNSLQTGVKMMAVRVRLDRTLTEREVFGYNLLALTRGLHVLCNEMNIRQMGSGTSLPVFNLRKRPEDSNSCQGTRDCESDLPIRTVVVDQIPVRIVLVSQGARDVDSDFFLPYERRR